MDILLIAGMWLDASVWRPVIEPLQARGHRAVPVALPGQGDGNTSATLADQVSAVTSAVDAADGNPMVVGHSAAATLAWLAADARPEKVGKVAFIGGFPDSDGKPYFDAFPLDGGAMPFPGWGPFEGPDSADLSDADKQAIAAAAVAVPEGVTHGLISLGDKRRFDVPTVVICPEFSPAQAKEAVDGGEVPELAAASRLSYADIDSGHWPMVSAPTRLAGLLADTADSSG